MAKTAETYAKVADTFTRKGNTEWAKAKSGEGDEHYRIASGGMAQIPGSDNAVIVPIQITIVLVGWIPFLGNAVNATTAAGVTESIGWWIADYFDKDLDESR